MPNMPKQAAHIRISAGIVINGIGSSKGRYSRQWNCRPIKFGLNAVDASRATRMRAVSDTQCAVGNLNSGLMDHTKMGLRNLVVFCL
jgi:hypothetical protein